MTDRAEPYVTPLVRALAARNGVALASLTGTGVGGRIRTADVHRAAAAQAAPPRARAAAPSAAPVDEPLRPVTAADIELPPFTASGVDPRELLALTLPGARAAAAAEPDRAKVLAMIRAEPVWPK